MPVAKLKGKPPVATDSYGPNAFSIAFERVQFVSRNVEIRDFHCSIQSSQLHPKTSSMICLDATGAARFVVQPQSLVLESLDHGLQCSVLRNSVKLHNAHQHRRQLRWRPIACDC